MIVIVQALVLAFVCVFVLMPAYLRLLKHAGFGKRVRREFGPEWHIVKEGTPTMGGLLLTGIVIALALLLDVVDASTYAVLLALLGVTLLGAFDDWLNQADDDDIDYALELVQRARTELTVKAMEIIDEAIEDSNKGDYIIAKGYLQKYTLNK